LFTSIIKKNPCKTLILAKNSNSRIFDESQLSYN
jgi:hypothetical protein